MNARDPKRATKPQRAMKRAVAEGRLRAVIDRVIPEIDGGRFPVKRVVGDIVQVEAHVFADGHDTLACVLGFRHESEPDWNEVPMTLKFNDEWFGEFPVDKLGRYRYTVT